MFDFVERTTSEAVPGVPPFDPRRSVDGERGIEIINPIPTSSAGLELEIHSKVTAVYDQGNAMISEHEHDLIDALTGRIYAKMTNTALGIGQGGYGGPKAPARPAAKTPPRQPDVVTAFKTTPEMALLYRLCGDYNPMHVDDEMCKRLGFKGVILQSSCTWNIAAHDLLRAVADSDPGRLKVFKARFNSVVYPGEVLETLIWKTGSRGRFDDYVFEMIVKSSGRVILSNGYAQIRQQSSKL